MKVDQDTSMSQLPTKPFVLHQVDSPSVQTLAEGDVLTRLSKHETLLLRKLTSDLQGSDLARLEQDALQRLKEFDYQSIVDETEGSDAKPRREGQKAKARRAVKAVFNSTLNAGLSGKASPKGMEKPLKKLELSFDGVNDWEAERRRRSKLKELCDTKRVREVLRTIDIRSK